jgi:hypothetical protein
MRKKFLLIAVLAALLALLSACLPVEPAPRVEPPAVPSGPIAPTEAPASSGAANPLPTAIVTVLPEGGSSGETPVQPPADDDPNPIATMPGVAYDDATCFTAAELQTLAPSELAGLETVCFQLDSGGTMEVGQAAAVELAQKAMADDALGLRFLSVTGMGNSPDGNLLVAQYEDRLGRVFSLLPDGSRLLEIDPGRYAPPSAGQSLSQDELRQKAEAFITALDPSFADLRAKLAFEGGAKGTYAFFRWTDASAQGWTSQPPMAQVGITPQGEVFSFINTLFLGHP